MTKRFLLGTLALAAATNLLWFVGCDASEFDKDYKSGEASVLQARVCPPDQSTSDPRYKVVTVTYSAASLQLDMVNGQVLGDDLMWTTHACVHADHKDRAGEASFLVRATSSDEPTFVRVAMFESVTCGADGGIDDARQERIFDLASANAGQCTTVTPAVDAGGDAGADAEGDADAETESDASPDGADADAEKMDADANQG